MPDSSPRQRALGLACLVAVLSGCEPMAREALVVATSWPADDRARIESEFAGWLGDHADPSSPGPIRIDWRVLAPCDDPERLAARRSPPDVLLGGPGRSYERLARAGRLAPLPIAGAPAWAVARASAVRRVWAPEVGRAADWDPRCLAFDDPRQDAASLAWADARLPRGLGADKFRTHYAALVRRAADRRRIGHQAGSASAAAERGEIAVAVGVTPTDPDRTPSGAIRWIEGVAIPAGSRRRADAERLVRFLAATGRAGPAPTGPDRAAPDDLDLLAELLGATLVDAQDELWAAWDALGRAGSPPMQVRHMTEPPPWPPASIAKLLGQPGEPAMAMVEALAGQVATDPAARGWLLSSWLSPPRPIDRRVLEELTRAADGRLVREPRFREWLRAEWTAWARQRYRRVRRVVEGGTPPR